MSETLPASKAKPPTLFNDPTFSDIKIHQICNGATKEYHAHRAILCEASGFLRKAFMGNFKEAFEPTMDVCDNSPVLFGGMLEFIYTRQYGESKLPRNSKINNSTIEALSLVDYYVLADKGDIQSLKITISARLYDQSPQFTLLGPRNQRNLQWVVIIDRN
ncbi:hypothetical protein BCR34DRAFT_579014 [Clohesyomyces aquaticus]|uniref:BTB domain-containing protein n=1 Tax=Clohesyomyces aquaticus TaxID=1231657 RepID=A0A1Y1YD04_9PLEO|nr:hypothetical protein BCR34DRAFT_579014 [Clohesyomyces aquaticus]